MVQSRGERSGVLLLTAWTEAGSPSGLRVRITWTIGRYRHVSHSEVVSSAEDVHDAVSTWLEELQREG